MFEQTIRILRYSFGHSTTESGEANNHKMTHKDKIPEHLLYLDWRKIYEDGTSPNQTLVIQPFRIVEKFPWPAEQT